MIYDTLDHIEHYKGICSNLDTAINFILDTDLSALPNGRTVINGDNVFVNVMDAQLKKQEAAMFEAHRYYADLQISLSGGESIGWLPVNKLPKTDDDNPLFRNYHGQADAMLPMEPDRFVIVFPQDAHSPCIGNGVSHKIVVKIKMTS